MMWVIILYLGVMPLVAAVNWKDGSLVAYYGFEEGTGNNTKDMTGKFNASGLSPMWSTNAKLGSYSINSTSFNANITAGIRLSLVQNYTFSVWVREDSSVDNTGVLGLGTTDRRQIWFFSSAPNLIQLSSYIGGVPKNIVNTTMLVSDGIWEHYVGRYNSTNFTLFKNGTVIAETNATGLLSTGNVDTAYNLIGKIPGFGTFHGLIDDIAIWNRSLSNTEILNLYNNGTGVSYFMTENSQTYNQTTKITKTETFVINITYDSSTYDSATANLIYNGTSYAGTGITSGNDTIFTRTLNIPTGLIGNINFYWNISLVNSIGTTYFLSSTNTQTISSIILSICNSTVNQSFINFTTYDMINYNIVNSSFSAVFHYGSGTTTNNYSYSQTGNNRSNFTFCVYPGDNSIIVDMDSQYSAPNYQNNWYYLRSANLTNTTTNIPLYLLNSGNATLTTLRVQDNYYNRLSERIIYIQRYDLATDSYYLIGMGKTNYNGEDIVYLSWYNTFYKFIILNNNAIEYTSNSSKVSSTPLTFTVKPDLIFDYDKFKDVSYSLTFNNITKNFILVFADTSGKITSGCLRVTQQNATSEGIICNDCLATTSGTIYCNIGEVNGTFTATFYSLGSKYIFGSLSITLRDIAESVYAALGNIDGTMMAIIMSGTIMAVGLFSPPVAILLLLVGLMISAAIGFTTINYVVFIGLCIVGGIIIWKLRI